MLPNRSYPPTGTVLIVVGPEQNNSGVVRVQDTLTNLRIQDGAAAAPAGPLTLEDLYRQHRMRLVRLALLLVDEPALGGTIAAAGVALLVLTGLRRPERGRR